MFRALLLLSLMFVPAAAEARASSDVGYSLPDAFSTALRFVRLDKGCTVKDKDPDTAYFTFECKDDEKIRHGALEIFKTAVGGRDGVRLQVSLGDDPHYVELRFLELLERKLREERGVPLPPLPPPAKKPAPNGGADD